eukprot:scaffold314128_cov32-Tisochrysis_lutea.AAC.1
MCATLARAQLLLRVNAHRSFQEEDERSTQHTSPVQAQHGSAGRLATQEANEDQIARGGHM